MTQPSGLAKATPEGISRPSVPDLTRGRSEGLSCMLAGPVWQGAGPALAPRIAPRPEALGRSRVRVEFELEGEAW